MATEIITSKIKINLIMIEINMETNVITMEIVTLIEIIKILKIETTGIIEEIKDLIEINKVEIMVDLIIVIDKGEIKDLVETDHQMKEEQRKILKT